MPVINNNQNQPSKGRAKSSTLNAPSLPSKKKTNQEGTRLNLLSIIKVLSSYSSKDKPMAISDICEKLKQIDLPLDSHTVSRTLNAIASSLEVSPKLSSFLNLKLHIVNSYGENIFDQLEDKKNRKYYYIENALRPAEIKMLTDAVEVYSYITHDQTSNLINKLNELQVPEMRSKYPRLGKSNCAPKIDSLSVDTNINLFDHIDKLNQAIRENYKVKITYGTYNIDKQLVQKSVKIVSPHQIMWANGYYYLVAVIKDRPYSYRIDRIMNVASYYDKEGNISVCDPLPESVKRNVTVGHDTFSPQLYQNTAVIMYSGIPEHIRIECKETMINTLLDSFGLNITIRKSHRKKGWVSVSFSAAIEGVALWLTQYCASSYAVAPQKLVEKVKKNLEKGLEYY
ncbi:MAG: WYL domain-containing protein [Clostridiales bacterium]|jgi:predicted DNA-binding transcriptional regulator YafY|nr:WYL domain-containing protein [Clostridiales bacterium]